MSTLVPPYIDRLTPYVPGKPIETLERELGIKDAIKLASNENPMGPSPRVIEAVRRAAEGLHFYPDASGYGLRAALSAHHDVPMEEISLGNGSNELIDLIARTFASPGDHAVIGNPSFVCYRLALTTANVPFTEVRLDGDLAWTVDALLGAVTDKTRLLFVANPNNPTGAHLGDRELLRLLHALPKDVLLVMDEAYVEFADAADFRSALAMRQERGRLLILRTFSKAYGMAGVRVGYAIGPRDAIGYLDRVRAPFNVSSIAQISARAALEDQEHVRQYVALNRTERARVSAALAAMSIRVAPSQANFLLIDSGMAGAQLYDRLLRQGVIVRPLPAPLQAWIRVTLGLPHQNDRFLEALRTALQQG